MHFVHEIAYHVIAEIVYRKNAPIYRALDMHLSSYNILVAAFYHIDIHTLIQDNFPLMLINAFCHF